MQSASITQLSSSAITKELRAVLAAASPGSAISIPMGNGPHVVLLLCGSTRRCRGGPACPPGGARSFNNPSHSQF